MSLAKVTEVAKARKDQGECDKCGVDIKVGDPYRWFKVGFRSHFKRVRCMKPECTPRPSERESSKMASIMSAQESATDSITLIEISPDQEDIDFSEITEEILAFVQEVVDAAREVASEYEEASTNDQGVVFNPDSEERAEMVTGAADELENFQISYDEPEDGEDVQDWLENVKQEAIDAIDGMEV